MRTRLRARLAAAAVAITVGVVLALFATTGPAVAFFSAGLFLDIQVEEPAHLVARGASVDVPVEITCNATNTVFVSVTVTQRVGKGIAGGTGFAEFACSGAGEDVVVRVRATVGGNAFIRGPAAVDAFISGCRPNICGSETDSETIRIRR